MERKFSINFLRLKIREACRRFPLTIGFSILASIALMVLFDDNWKSEGSIQERWYLFLMLYPSSAIFVSLVGKLWSEDISTRSKASLVNVGVNVGWLVLSLAICFVVYSLIIFVTTIIALLLAVFIMLFLTPFVLHGRELACWHSTCRLLGGLLISEITVLLAFGGLSLLYFAFEQLFEISVYWKVYYYTWVLLQVFVYTVLFLQFIPTAEESRQDKPWTISPKLVGIIHYVMIPIVLAYLLTLYVYGLKILFSWQLPDGLVSILVSAMMLSMLVILSLIYPNRFNEKKRFDQLLFRWFPVVMLPLLVLMSVGIGRRISDYGLTVQRLYVLTFNIWSYLVCLGLIWTKGRRMLWIPLSFAVIAVLTSVGPQSYANLVMYKMRAEVIECMESQGITKFPISAQTLSSMVSYLDGKTREHFIGQAKYLLDNYDFNRMDDYWAPSVQSDIAWYSDNLSLTGRDGSGASSVQLPDNVYQDNTLTTVQTLNRAYRKIVAVENTSVLNYQDKFFEFIISKGGKKFHFRANNALFQREAARGQLHPITATNGQAVFYFTSVSILYNEKQCTLKGMLLYN